MTDPNLWPSDPITDEEFQAAKDRLLAQLGGGASGTPTA